MPFTFKGIAKLFRWILLALPLFSFLILEAKEDTIGRALVLRSPGDNTGLFSAFTTVMGFLMFLEHNECETAKIDFADKGLYYDPAMGLNWWNYYFLPIETDRSSTFAWETVSKKLKRKFTSIGCNEITRQEAFSLIQKYVKVKPDIRKKVDQFVRTQFGDANVIGVHYRGTDKRTEASRVPYKKVYEKLKAVVGSLTSDNFKIFVATDEKLFLDFIMKKYPNHVIYTDALRSMHGKPVHQSYKNCYKMGEDAVIDCLLLSKCGILIRTASNLSTCAGFFNPDLPTINLNILYIESSRLEW